MINKIIRIFMLVAILAATGACTDDFEEVNTDPNNPDEVSPANLLTQAQFALADRTWGRALNFEFGMLMVQHFSQNEYAEDSRYNQNESTFSTPWNSFYASGLKDIVEAKRLLEEGPNDGLTEAQVQNQIATLELMRVWAMQIVTDIWINVPYEQAFNIEEFPNPRYSSQEDIYNGLIDELNTAIGRINASASGFTSGDVFYNGDMAAWQSFANSLKLRIAMRIADVDAATAGTLATQAINDGVFTSNADNFSFVFNADQRIANPFYVDASVNNRDDFAISDVLVQALRDRNDPRLNAFAKPNIEDSIAGLPYGLTDGEAFALKAITSRPADAIRSATAPAELLTYSEVAFLHAEAIERGLVPGVAATEYANGITASMNQWGIDDAVAISDYILANPYDGANYRQSIGEQKWIALYTNGLEAWSEWRRLDFPQLEVPEAAVQESIPVRAFYPAVELGNNPTSVAESGIQNVMSVKPWWDMN